MKKILVNHSNHPSMNWIDKQKEGWNIIVDIPFPSNIDPTWSVIEVEKLVEKNIDTIRKEVQKYEHEDLYIMVQGEYTYSYLFLLKLKELKEKVAIPAKVAIPTTERIVEQSLDGKKISVFRFQQWRIIEI